MSEEVSEEVSNEIDKIVGKIGDSIKEATHEDHVVSALVSCLACVIVDGATVDFNTDMRFLSAVDLLSTYIHRNKAINTFEKSTEGIH